MRPDIIYILNNGDLASVQNNPLLFRYWDQKQKRFTGGWPTWRNDINIVAKVVVKYKPLSKNKTLFQRIKNLFK